MYFAVISVPLWCLCDKFQEEILDNEQTANCFSGDVLVKTKKLNLSNYSLEAFSSEWQTIYCSILADHGISVGNGSYQLHAEEWKLMKTKASCLKNCLVRLEHQNFRLECQAVWVMKSKGWEKSSVSDSDHIFAVYVFALTTDKVSEDQLSPGTTETFSCFLDVLVKWWPNFLSYSFGAAQRRWTTRIFTFFRSRQSSVQ